MKKLFWLLVLVGLVGLCLFRFRFKRTEQAAKNPVADYTTNLQTDVKKAEDAAARAKAAIQRISKESQKGEQEAEGK